MTHAPILFPIDGDDMLIGGMPVRLLAERMSSTPFYAYDRAMMSGRVAELRAALPKDVRLHYAMKCNPMPDVVAHFVPMVDGVDVASANEMDVALAAGAKHVSFAGPGKSKDDIERAVAAGIVLNIESERELRAAVKAGEALGKTPRIALRVNPSFELKASGMKMGGVPSQFGVDAERAPDVLREIESSGVSFEGFHIFAGSQNLRAESLIETQAKTLALTMELAAATPMKVKLANIGGGFGIPYAPGDKRLDIAPIGEALERAMEEFRARMPETEVAIELGRYLAGEAGVYICRVIDKKISRGQVFLITDGGLHHHLAASGNFGQVIRRNYPVVAPAHMGSSDRETAHVVGPLCTPLDLLGAAVDLPKLDVGDLVAVLQSGAYGLTASPTAFLSHPRPGEILV
jgi:diaminopimelate decarboxylase